MASTPTYDPNLIEKPGGYATRAEDPRRLRRRVGAAQPRDAGPLHAGLDVQDRHRRGRARHGRVHAELRVRRSRLLHGVRQAGVERRQPRPGRARGVRAPQLRRRRSSTPSTRCSATSACKIGAGTILEYAKKFGFYKTPPLETPGNERAPSGLYNGTTALRPEGPRDQVDPGRLAFGQERMLVTPLQMAMVAATIANGGVVPKPYVVQKIVTHDGSTVRNTKPGNLGRAIKPETAATLTQMMVAVTEGGTGNCRRDPRHPRRRQDGHRGDRAQPRLHGLVHLVRARGERRRSRSRSCSRSS